MTAVPYISILFAWALIYVPRFVVSREMKKLEGGYDNHDPRGQQRQLDGIGQRALAAHHNGSEAFAPFAVAVFAALSRGVDLRTVSGLAIGFVVVRVIFLAAYLDDRSRLRSGMWALGMAATGALMMLRRDRPWRLTSRPTPRCALIRIGRAAITSRCPITGTTCCRRAAS